MQIQILQKNEIVASLSACYPSTPARFVWAFINTSESISHFHDTFRHTLWKVQSDWHQFRSLKFFLHTMRSHICACYEFKLISPSPQFVLATSTTSSARSCCCVKLHSRRHITWPGFTFLWPVCAVEPHLFFRFDHSIFPSRSVCRKSCDFILIQSRAISGGSVEWNLKEAQPFWHDEKLHFSLSHAIPFQLCETNLIN